MPSTSVASSRPDSRIPGANGSQPLILALPHNDTLAQALAGELNVDYAMVETRQFPDGESYVRLPVPTLDRDVVLVCTLDRPDGKLLPLLFAAATARELGARRVGLLAPYLAYMRQDRRFNPGEAVTASEVARLLSNAMDWLITVDPHLHRIHDLGEVYAIPCTVVQAAPYIAEWIAQNVPRAVLVGPDEESAQWVQAVASLAAVPYTILAKTRRGDRDVAVSPPMIEQWSGHVPVLVDDIVSTARTMAVTVRHLISAGLHPPICIGVHAIFAGDAEEALRASGAAQVITCDSVPHATNGISLLSAITPALRHHLGR